MLKQTATKPALTEYNYSSVEVEGVSTVGSLESQIALYAAVVLMGIIIFVGCIGNLMAILAVRTTRKLQTVSNAFVVNLSVCDLMFVTLILPFNMYTYITDSWDLPMALCKTIGFLGYTLTGTTIITITLIAWNRYKLVVDSQGYQHLFKKRNMILMLSLTWIFPMASLLPAVVEIWGRFGYVTMMVTCNLLLDHSSQSFKLFLLIVRAVIPCILITYYYGSIYRTTKASHDRVRKGRLLMTVCRLEQMIQRKEMHLTKMMGTIFIVFALSYFPCTISSIVDWNTVLSKRFHMFCLITVYMGSAVNPLIYGLMNSQFRMAYYTILLCQCGGKSRDRLASSRTDAETASPAMSNKFYKKNLRKAWNRQLSKKVKPLTQNYDSSTPTATPPKERKDLCHYHKYNELDCQTPVSSPEPDVRAHKKKNSGVRHSTSTSKLVSSSPVSSVHSYRKLHRTETEKTCIGGGDYDSEDSLRSNESFRAVTP